VTNVLVVDDHISEARSFADLITAKTGLQCIATDDPENAISLAEGTGFSVLVLDESMPRMDGTALYDRIRGRLPWAKALMLTQEDDATAAGRAIELGYGGRLHKSQISQLPDAVLRLHIEATATHALIQSTSAVVHRQRLLGWTQHTVRLVSVTSLNDAFVDPSEWKQVVEINAGQERKISSQETLSMSVSFEHETKESLSSALGFKLKAVTEISGELSEAIDERYAVAWSGTSTAVETLEDTYRLPAEPADPKTLHVRSRHYQSAPVYRRLQIVLASQCHRCDRVQIKPAVVRQRLPLVALRQLDYLSDGSEKCVDTGFRRLEA
jgi:DNA-binding NarL/FixJ family response regulator